MDAYRVAVKESVFEWTGLSPEAVGEDREIQFINPADAETWVATMNDRFDMPADLTLRDPHPNDASGVDAYLTVQPQKVWTVE